MKLRVRLIGTIILLVLVSVFSTIRITSYIVNIQISKEFENNMKATAQITYDYLDSEFEGEWKCKDGKLFKGMNCLNDNMAFVDKVKEDTNYYVTLCANDVRVATNIIADGKRVIGTQVEQEVVDKVINEGETYQGLTNVFGNELEAIYLPLKSYDGTVAGMLFIGAPRITMNESELRATLVQIVVLLIALLAIIVTTVIYLNGIIKAVNTSVRHLNRMANKEFTSKVHKKLVKRKDEFGTVFKATANMQKVIGMTVDDIRTSTDQVNTTIIDSTNHLSELDQSIDKISAVTQEMAASFEETAASTQEINASIIEMRQAVEDVSSQIKESEAKAQISEQKSLQVKEEAKESINNTLKMIEHNRELITKAIEQSQSIEQISKLSDTILDIASETNLLSLNATIEAARAGESGRSFAVVANQIKSLSESSQKAVAEIQSVVQVVIESVKNLVSTSKELMNFIDQKVTGDYKLLESTGEEYYDSTQYFANILTEISKTSEELLSRVEMISASINEVTTATNDNSEAVTQIANNIVDVDARANEVLQLMKKTEDVSKFLDELASSFKTQANA
ncbi:MAG: methyl-accepting chemotaxis protein [Clostridiales bacterium]|nr:methyl-accepting chemotaxis protein [Clostridiales bacterium]